MLSNDTTGENPALSPDGSRLAYRVYSGRVANGTIAVLDLLRGTRTTIVGDPTLRPVGWLDDTSLYVVRTDTISWDPRTLELLRTRSGRGKVLGTFPKAGTYFHCQVGFFTMSPDWRTAVCWEGEPNTDIWLVDDFDAAYQMGSE